MATRKAKPGEQQVKGLARFLNRGKELDDRIYEATGERGAKPSQAPAKKASPAKKSSGKKK